MAGGQELWHERPLASRNLGAKPLERADSPPNLLASAPFWQNRCRKVGLHANGDADLPVNGALCQKPWLLPQAARHALARLSSPCRETPPSLPVCIDKLRTITSPAAHPARQLQCQKKSSPSKWAAQDGRYGCSKVAGSARKKLAGGVKVAGSARRRLRRVRAASRGSKGTQARWSSSRPGWRCTSGRRWAGSTSWRLPKRWCSRSRGPGRPRGRE